MRKSVALFFLMIAFSYIALSQTQEQGSHICKTAKSKTLAHAKTTVADVTEDDYDVKYVKINLSVDNLSTNISGEVTTIAEVVANGMNDYVFELLNFYIIDSVKINGQLATVSNLGNHVRSVALPTQLSQNSTFTAQVFYHGQAFGNDLGIINDSSPSWGTEVTYTLSEPYESKDWWPCKQSLTDKIDSTDIWITVPDNLMAGANGVLKNVTPIAGGFSRYEWKMNILVSYYLLSFSVAPYIDYSYYVNFPNSNDSVLIQNYVYGDNLNTLPFWKSRIDSVKDMMLHFSDLLGRYPFWQEKYGHCMAPMNGGMEHQTMTTQGNFGTLLSAHELVHQWFGDLVTCATWKDIWLNEGFASYGEYLFIEKFWDAAKAAAHMNSKHTEVLGNIGGTLYVDDTTDANRIFDGRLTYSKGASVVHMLRFVVGDDAKFFNMLQDYLQTYKNGNATTDEFKNTASQFLQYDLDTFVNQWVYGAGYPNYKATWNQIHDTIIIKLDQTVTGNATVSLFHTPIELKFSSPNGDTIVRVNNSQATQKYYFVWNKSMNGMGIDPNDWLLNFDLGTSKDASLTRTDEVRKTEIEIYPNPTNNDWIITNLPVNADLKLYDISGKQVLHSKTTLSIHTINAQHLATGVYQLRIESKNENSTIKLIKK